MFTLFLSGYGAQSCAPRQALYVNDGESFHGEVRKKKESVSDV